MKMNLKEAIFGRRAVRDYLDREVPRTKIMELLHVAAEAPSAINQQPWAFAVFQGKERLKNYSDRAKKEYLRTIDLSQPDVARLKGHLIDPNFNMFYNAGTLIVIFARPQCMNPEGDCWMAAQNLMLSAHADGLGTCPIGLAWAWFRLRETKRELGIPLELTVVAPIILGYPAEKPDHPPRNEPSIIVWK